MSPVLSELTRRVSGALAVPLLAVGASPAAHAALEGRDLDAVTAGFEAYYDTALNITWLADANYAKTSNYAAANSSGRMTWDEAQTWAGDLMIGGYSDWRLPTMVDTGSLGCNYSEKGGTDCGYNVQTIDVSTGAAYSEMAHLYYVTLGNKGYATPGTGVYPQAEWGLSNTGPFSNVQPYYYWFGTEYAPNTGDAWYFAAIDGLQYNYYKEVEFSAWAVRAGDIATAAVPEPSSYALMGLGLAAVLVARRRQHH